MNLLKSERKKLIEKLDGHIDPFFERFMFVIFQDDWHNVFQRQIPRHNTEGKSNPSHQVCLKIIFFWKPQIRSVFIFY